MIDHLLSDQLADVPYGWQRRMSRWSIRRKCIKHYWITRLRLRNDDILCIGDLHKLDSSYISILSGIK